MFPRDDTIFIQNMKHFYIKGDKTMQLTSRGSALTTATGEMRSFVYINVYSKTVDVSFSKFVLIDWLRNVLFWFVLFFKLFSIFVLVLLFFVLFFFVCLFLCLFVCLCFFLSFFLSFVFLTALYITCHLRYSKWLLFPFCCIKSMACFHSFFPNYKLHPS